MCDNRARGDESDDSLTDLSRSEDSEDVSEDDGATQGWNSMGHPQKQESLRVKLTKGPGMLSLEMSAPDPSIGNTKELFKMTLADNWTMCEKLSPGLMSKP